MPTRLTSVIVDAADPHGLARWWASALDWTKLRDSGDETAIEGPTEGFHIEFVPVTEPKQGKNRVHFDLACASRPAQEAAVARLIGAGASRTDIGQHDVPWVVLADPEGNEFCVLDERSKYDTTGSLAAVVMDVADPTAEGRFWSAAAGWPVTIGADGDATLWPPVPGIPFLELLADPGPKVVKNRLHLDVAPYASDDQHAEVERLVELGARRVDVGQRDVNWVVLADPEGNEFCVLTPR